MASVHQVGRGSPAQIPQQGDESRKPGFFVCEAFSRSYNGSSTGPVLAWRQRNAAHLGPIRANVLLTRSLFKRRFQISCPQ
jgi:hypothetical protein